MKRVAIFDGRLSHNERNGILQDNYEALILQIQTGCEGLNLQDNYSEIYFISPHWNPTVEEQAIARCHRIGQTKPVIVYKFQMSAFSGNNKPTVENHMINVQNTKNKLANEFL